MLAGQAGINIMGFCKDFNAKTANYKEGVPLRVSLMECCHAGWHAHPYLAVTSICFFLVHQVFVRVYNDKTYDWILKTPPTTWLIK